MCSREGVKEQHQMDYCMATSYLHFQALEKNADKEGSPGNKDAEEEDPGQLKEGEPCKNNGCKAVSTLSSLLQYTIVFCVRLLQCCHNF